MQALLAGYCMLGALALDIPRDIGVLTGLLVVCWGVATLSVLRRHLEIVERGVSYVLVAILAYLVTQVGWAWPLPFGFESSLIGLIAITMAATLRYSPTCRFRLNSMDLLVLFTAVVVPSLPGTLFGNVNVSAIAARLAVLFYATEVAFDKGIGGQSAYRIALFASLATMTIRAFM
jgi:hypothetical protein